MEETIQAFPNEGNSTWGMQPTYGMTLRDYFAGQALTGIIATIDGPGFLNWDYYSDAAYHIADAMLAARKGDDA